MKIDVHNHFLPESVVDFIRVHGDKLNTEIVVKGGAEHIGLDHLPHVSAYIADWVTGTFAELAAGRPS